jgi:hypothetical protein
VHQLQNPQGICCMFFCLNFLKFSNRTLLVHQPFLADLVQQAFDWSSLQSACILLMVSPSCFAAARVHCPITVQLVRTKTCVPRSGSGTWPCWPCMAGRSGTLPPQPLCDRPAATQSRRWRQQLPSCCSGCAGRLGHDFYLGLQLPAVHGLGSARGAC